MKCSECDAPASIATDGFHCSECGVGVPSGFMAALCDEHRDGALDVVSVDCVNGYSHGLQYRDLSTGRALNWTLIPA